MPIGVNGVLVSIPEKNKITKELRSPLRVRICHIDRHESFLK